MKVTLTVICLTAVLTGAVALVLGRRPVPEPVQHPAFHSMKTEEPAEALEITPAAVYRTNIIIRFEQQPVQPVEERGDAMLFEIDALQNTPFDQPITMPFD